MEMVCMLLGLVPSFVTGVHLWRRTDVGYAQFTWWAMVILVPWAGPLTYIACTSMTPIAAPLLIVIGSWLLYAYCAGPGGEIIRTRTWQRANVVDFDSGGTYEFHTVSQLRPRYTYVYEGKRFTGNRFNLSDPPWYDSDYPRGGSIRPFVVNVVYVNPNNPAESVAFLAPRPSEHARAAAGFILVTSGIVSIVNRLRRRAAVRRCRRAAGLGPIDD